MLVKIIAIMVENTFTTDDLVERVGLMRLYLGKRLFGEKGEGAATLREVLQHECSEETLNRLEAWMRGFREAALSPLTVYESLSSVEEELGGLPSITVYVPIRFSLKDIEGFGSWFRSHVQPNLLLTVRVDPKAVGGCAFVHNNVYYNFAFPYYLDKSRSSVLAMFDRHLTPTHAAQH